ncbi:SDR family oxidoreductase [Actinoplanes sp. NPDC051343]|uniref:SDR family oxidoreductase n=1 Tax=Actinoplanes sp. NPDC051343 TaxID=3363906 RepID=UPI003795AD6A
MSSLARSLGRDLLPAGIRVNAVSPGPIATPILDKAIPRPLPTRCERFRDTNPSSRGLRRLPSRNGCHGHRSP